MGVFWDKIKKMRENSRPFTRKETNTPTETAKPAEIKLFAPIPDKEVGESKKPSKKPKKRKETAVNENDGTAD